MSFTLETLKDLEQPKNGFQKGSFVVNLLQGSYLKTFIFVIILSPLLVLLLTLTYECSPKHEAFMLGTSKSKQDSRGFELFITTAPIPNLNDKLIVFGRVIKGEDVVQV